MVDIFYCDFEQFYLAGGETDLTLTAQPVDILTINGGCSSYQYPETQSRHGGAAGYLGGANTGRPLILPHSSHPVH